MPPPAELRVAVVGLGYVGTVTAACLAERGVEVVGVDIDDAKVRAVSAGTAPFSEPGLPELLAAGVAGGTLSATTDLPKALARTRVWIVTVGTPTGVDGDADLRAVHRVVGAMRRAIRDADLPPFVVLSSTVPPGTSESVVLPTLEQDGLTEGVDFFFAYSPEFLREGSAIEDYRRPERTVAGTRTDASRRAAERFFARFDEDVLLVEVATAEFAKYTDNTWHALKVVFANEVARIGDAFGVDARAAMDLFARDRRLNISPAYLTPGFAFGGSCLPKDVRTMAVRARAAGVDAPVITSILDSNQAHVHAAVRLVEALEPGLVVIAGLAFKAGTDDLRESPALPLARRLLASGCKLAVFDPAIDPRRLQGANALQLQLDLPDHRDVLTADIDVIESADVVVVTQRGPLGREVASRLRDGQTLVDLAGVLRPSDTEGRYLGLAWP
jgi:GDP-mannose 6-dehydrogenase